MPSPRDIAKLVAQHKGYKINASRNLSNKGRVAQELGRAINDPSHGSFFKRRWQVKNETFKPGVNGKGTPKLPQKAYKPVGKPVGPISKNDSRLKKPTVAYNDWSASAKTQAQRPSYNPGTRTSANTSPGERAPWSVDNQKLKPGLNGTGTPGYQKPLPKKTVPSKRAV